MKVEQNQVKTLKISDIPGLDLITVYLEDLGVNKGKITIECYGWHD